MCYVNISVITDYDAGLEGEHGIAPFQWLLRLRYITEYRPRPRRHSAHRADGSRWPHVSLCGICDGRLICWPWEIEHVSNGHYLAAIADFYDDPARQPEVGLCCVGGNQLPLVDLYVPPEMEAMDCWSADWPIDVGDRTAKLLASTSDIVAAASTFHYDGAGTC